MTTSDLVEVILRVAAEMNETLETRIPVERGEDTPLYGRNGVLDSIGLVSLVATLEQEIDTEFGRTVSLADERAVSQKSSPFRTVGTLAAYAGQLLAEQE